MAENQNSPQLSQAEKFARAAGNDRGGAPRSDWRKGLKRGAILLAGGYVLICVIFFLFQRTFVYRATRQAELRPEDFGFSRSQAILIHTQSSDGVTLGGWQIRAGRRRIPTELTKAPLVNLFFCGSAGNRSDRNDFFRRMTSLGINTICFDYRGYGDSSGSPGEDGLQKDARAALDYLTAQGVKPQAIILDGEGLGASVALRLAAQMCADKQPPAALILQSAFSDLSIPVGRQYPFLPAGLMLSDRFKVADRLAAVTCPVIMIHGAQDNLAPIGQARQMFDALPAQSASGLAKRWIELPLCGADDLGIHDAGAYDAAIKEFLTAVCPALSPPRTDAKPKDRPHHEKRSLNPKAPSSEKPLPP